MHARLAAIICATILLPACQGQPPVKDFEYSGDLVEKRSIGDDTVTVEVVSGSTWGALGQLRELAVLGLEGNQEALLGGPTAVAVDESGQRIFVADNRFVAVKLFAFDGSYLGQVGRRGEGPGEYVQPTGIAYDAGQNRLLVRDASRSRVLIYDATGEYLKQVDTHPANLFPEHFYFKAPDWVYVESMLRGLGEVQGRTLLGTNLSTAQTDTLPIISGSDGLPMLRRGANPLPFGTERMRTLGRDGTIVEGHSREYRFSIQHPNAEPIHVRVDWTPIQLSDDEWKWWDRRTEVLLGENAAEWRRNGPEIPRIKPAFASLHLGTDGSIWVTRSGRGMKLPGCAEGFDDRRALAQAPCWGSRLLLDVFDRDGTYQGRVYLPADYVYFDIGWAGDKRFAAVYGTSEGLLATLYAEVEVQ